MISRPANTGLSQLLRSITNGFALSLFLCITINICYAQRQLTNSRQSSYYTYIYKIATADVAKIYLKPDDVFTDKALEHPVDSFRTDKYWENTLQPGNYVRVFAEKGKLKYTLIENHSAFIKLLDNKYDQRFIFTDKQGKSVIPTVKENGRPVIFDEKSGTYHLSKSKKKSIVQADFNGVSNFFIVQEKGYDENDDDYKESWPARLWVSIKKLFKKNPENHYKPVIRDYTAFIAFNKPKYKPHDTVKFKTFILTSKAKKPVFQKQLLVELDNDELTQLGKVDSYRDGGFESSVVLNDSLKLRLDEGYHILLVDPAIAKRQAGESHDGYDKEGHKILSAGNFRYEDYELKSINFNARIDKTEHRPGEKAAIYLKATDENGLPVADGRVSLTITTSYSNSYKADHVFLPDTLWTHKAELDPLGETKVVIPDSIFPKADVNYNVYADFLNAANERRQEQLGGKYVYDRYQITTRLNGDTLEAACFEFGKEIKVRAIICALNAKDDTLSAVKVMLPSKTIVNPNAKTYTIETDSSEVDLELQKENPNLSIGAERTADSLFVNITNPRNLHFWYTIFAGNKIIDAGEAGRLFYKKKYSERKNVGVVVNYIWGGESREQSVGDIVYRQDKLTIAVKQPVTVFPGQRAETDIVVTDADGKPVANADLTAWAITRKFENYGMPDVPYLGRQYARRQFKKNYELDDAGNAGTMALNWARWSREMGLDSIAYFQFTHPKTICQREEQGIDTITQVAPFVVKDGEIIPVHILYIDEKPVYFSQAQQLQYYSFRVRPGFHSLRFRTSKQIIRLDSVCVDPNRKLILSVDAGYGKSIKASDTLGQYEGDLINKYMVTVVNNFENRKVLLKQHEDVFFLNPFGSRDRDILTGPLADNFTLLDIQGEKLRSFYAEPGYSFLFEPGLLKQKSISAKYPFNTRLSTAAGTDNYSQYVLTEAKADSIWQEFLYNRSHMQELFVNEKPAFGQLGKLEIQVSLKKLPYRDIRNVIVYKYDDPDFIRIYAGRDADLGNFKEGRYRLFFLLKDDTYDIKEDIIVKPFGINHYKMEVIPAHSRDSVSIKIRNIIDSRIGGLQSSDYQLDNDALKLKEAFNEKYLNRAIMNGTMTGVVLGKGDKQPLVGVSIVIKGTNIGTTTDITGHFNIQVPPYGKLLLKYIGYRSHEADIKPGTAATILLEEMSRSLQEVVVIGYGVQKKMDVTGAISSVLLQGQAAGINVVDGAPGSAPRIYLRGLNTIHKQPLYVIDGVIVKGLEGVALDSIGSITVLKDAGATALYGAAGSDGVVIISTKKENKNTSAAAGPAGDNDISIRKNFSDYAYWQPRLITDANGKATFTTIFPDDITNWRTFVIGVNGNRQAGIYENQIKAYKPLSAAFLAPLFAVEGDELNTLGKVTNYAGDTAKVNRTFTFNGKQVKRDQLDITNSKIDTLNITAPNTDSLTFEYSIKRDNGYFDGERRKIPVIKQGVKETQGIFEALNNDTTVNLKFDPAKGAVTFHAEASVLAVLLEEAQKLREYKYLCNEQLASKLEGLLTEKRIKVFLGKKFGYEKNINELIKKLEGNRKTQGTWGWWKDSDEELWISLHAIEALTDARKDGYNVELDKQKLTDYLVYQLESYKGQDKLICLELLRKLEAKIDYAKYFDVIEKEHAVSKEKLTPVSGYDKFRLMLMKQEAGVPISLDSLLAAKKHTLFGNIYWGEDNYRFFDNSVQLTVLVYKIIKNDGKHNNLLPKIRGYFLEQRHTGDWRNTYESALILATILSDVLTAEKQTQPAVLTIKGAKTETITKFPYTTALNQNEVSVSKTGTLPVYITGYQQFWNPKPEKIDKDFTVDTWFEKNGAHLSNLKGGDPIRLKAEITSKGDADFVMIEIPIPAGCSYESKEQSWQNNEVHREYFKEKVSIFCRKLKQGKYEFTVDLIPRYNGKYNLNPAKAEMMYFPVFYGREGMKKVKIGE